MKSNNINIANNENICKPSEHIFWAVNSLVRFYLRHRDIGRVKGRCLFQTFENWSEERKDLRSGEKHNEENIYIQSGLVPLDRYAQVILF